MSHDDDRIEELLRRDASTGLGDEGFTARVMGALPARATPASAWKPALVLGSTGLGCVLAAFFAPPDANIVQGFRDLALWRGLTPAAIAGLALTASMLVSAIVLAADTD